MDNEYLYEVIETMQFVYYVNAKNVDEALEKSVVLGYSDAQHWNRLELIAKRKANNE